MAGLGLSFVVSKAFWLQNNKAARLVSSIRTKTFLEEQTLEKHVLSISWFVANAYFLVYRAETGFYQVQCPETIRTKSNAST
jgi:hypothetical protein